MSTYSAASKAAAAVATNGALQVHCNVSYKLQADAQIQHHAPRRQLWQSVAFPKLVTHPNAD